MLGWNKMFEYTFNIDFTKVSGYTAMDRVYKIGLQLFNLGTRSASIPSAK